MSVDSNSPVDPRIQVELEQLNNATDNINKYEVELDEAKSDFKQLLLESAEKIKLSAHKLSNSIQTAKPYYEARLYAAQLAKECQQAANNHEKAKSIHSAAKEMVYLAEQGLGEKSTLDTACQEMLSHAASRVNESQLECTDSKNTMKICELKYEVANNRVAKLQSQLKSAIKASSYNIRRTLLLINLTAYKHEISMLPYYETRANYNGVLKAQKKRIMELENRVRDAKLTYNEALKNLEKISEEIHKMRDERGSCNGADDQNFANRRQLHNSRNDEDEGGQHRPYLSKHNNYINSPDEYLDFPTKLTTKSSPIRQKNLEKLECPHLLQDFVGYPQQSTSENSLSPSKADNITISSDEIEQWTEIRLSNSESTSSGYSQQSNVDDNGTPTDISTASSSAGGNAKVTCTIFHMDENVKKETDESLSTWITKSNLKNSSRRQSLDILIDAGDRVKDAFATSFQRVGKSLERRNSESEVNQQESSTDFFSFSRSENKDGLSDEQVENLLLNEDCTADMLKNVLNISK